MEMSGARETLGQALEGIFWRKFCLQNVHGGFFFFFFFGEQPHPAGLTGRCCICFGTASVLGCNSIIQGLFSSLLQGFPGTKKKGISPVFPFSGNGSAQTRLCCFLLEMREFCCCICTPRNSPGNNKPSSHITAVPMRQPQNLPPHPAATLVWQKSWQGAARHEMIKASTKKPREQRALHPGTSEFHPQDLCNPKEN